MHAAWVPGSCRNLLAKCHYYMYPRLRVKGTLLDVHQGLSMHLITVRAFLDISGSVFVVVVCFFFVN